MHIIIKNKYLIFDDYRVKCAIGKRGIKIKKKEGDLITPKGTYSLSKLLYRKDRVKNLKTGKTIDKTFKSGENVEAADVMDTDMQYLYTDGEFWHFMVQDTFEQYAAGEAAVAEAKMWLKDQDICQVTLWNNEPLIVNPPNFVELEIVETDPGVRGDTASGGIKPATLSTGAVIRVPLFIEQGEIVRIDTRSKEYVSRVK